MSYRLSIGLLLYEGKNTGAAIHVTRLLKFKTKFHFKYIKVLNFEVKCVCVCVCGRGEGGATLTSLAYFN